MTSEPTTPTGSLERTIFQLRPQSGLAQTTEGPQGDNSAVPTASKKKGKSKAKPGSSSQAAEAGHTLSLSGVSIQTNIPMPPTELERQRNEILKHIAEERREGRLPLLQTDGAGAAVPVQSLPRRKPLVIDLNDAKKVPTLSALINIGLDNEEPTRTHDEETEHPRPGADTTRTSAPVRISPRSRSLLLKHLDDADGVPSYPVLINKEDQAEESLIVQNEESEHAQPDTAPIEQSTSTTLAYPTVVSAEPDRTFPDPTSPESDREVPASDTDDDKTIIDREFQHAKEEWFRVRKRPLTPRHARHRRIVSTDSAVKPVPKRSVPIKNRRVTNDGIVEFKAKADAGASKEHSSMAPPEKPSRRKISVAIPVKVQPAQPPLPTPLSASTLVNEVPPETEKEERELEYKHRHTFIGTASLDDFLELLELSSAHTTTKRQVAKAFVLLAAAEQVQARQSSTSGSGWELVARITPDIAPGYADYLNQAHVKLGSISLCQFLELVRWDEKEEVAALSVVEAFCAASHIDRGVVAGTRSKARAFRSWMVKQEKEC